MPSKTKSATLSDQPVNIGEAARLSGVSAKMLRHYESLGLLGTVTRTDSGYRLYSPADVHTLRFIKRCRDLGFSMAEIGELVGLWQNKRRASANVKKIAQKHMDELSERIAAMHSKPQISCDIGTGTSFINQHLDTGFVVPPEDPESLAAAMNRLIADDVEAQAMGHRARQRYEQHFTGAIMARSYAALYQSVTPH